MYMVACVSHAPHVAAEAPPVPPPGVAAVLCNVLMQRADNASNLVLETKLHQPFSHHPVVGHPGPLRGPFPCLGPQLASDWNHHSKNFSEEDESAGVRKMRISESFTGAPHRFFVDVQGRFESRGDFVEGMLPAPPGDSDRRCFKHPQARRDSI